MTEIQLKESENLLKFIADICPFVSKMEKQLNADQANKLLSLYPLLDIKRQVLRMDNWRGIEKKNRSVYQTILKWFEMDIEAGRYKYPEKLKSKVSAKEDDYKERFLKKHPIGSEFTLFKQIWIVVDDVHVTQKNDNNKIILIKQLKRFLSL